MNLLISAAPPELIRVITPEDKAKKTFSEQYAVRTKIYQTYSLFYRYIGVNDSISDFVSLTTDSGDTLLAVDQDGTGTTYSSQTIVRIEGVTGLNLNDMITDGNVVV